MIIFINDRKVPPSRIEQAGRQNVLTTPDRLCRQTVGWSIVSTMMHINTLRFLLVKISRIILRTAAGHRLSRTDPVDTVDKHPSSRTDERTGDERTLCCVNSLKNFNNNSRRLSIFPEGGLIKSQQELSGTVCNALIGARSTHKCPSAYYLQH